MDNTNIIVGGGSYISKRYPRTTTYVSKKTYPGVKNVLSTLTPKPYVYHYYPSLYQRQMIPDRRDLISEPVIAKPIIRNSEPVIAKPIIRDSEQVIAKPIAKKIMIPPLEGDQYISLDLSLPQSEILIGGASEVLITVSNANPGDIIILKKAAISKTEVVETTIPGTTIEAFNAMLSIRDTRIKVIIPPGAGLSGVIILQV